MNCKSIEWGSEIIKEEDIWVARIGNRLMPLPKHRIYRTKRYDVGRKVSIEVNSLLKPFSNRDGLAPSIPVDPLGAMDDMGMVATILQAFCGPNNTNTWATDSQPDCTFTTTPNFSKCFKSTCLPVLGVLSTPVATSTSTWNSDSAILSAYAVPSVQASVSPCNASISGVYNIPNGELLKGFACQDSNNKAYYNSFSALDNTTNSYTIAGLALLELAPGAGLNTPDFTIWAFYNLSSSVTKGSTDIYYYVYRLGFYYV